MGRAYAYANGDAPMPAEIELGNAVNRYGGMAVYGRTIGALEMRSIAIAEKVVNAFHARQGNTALGDQSNWATWSETNQGLADLLGLALREALDLGLIE
ncbi:hypothetical protein LCGC14_1756010 [marine sediment metagenome]|uniref:Uncharacterized protein n=1 Tax=marine sediment metagenome TaxID=412755 RepID=A0A0F9HPU7_9ZZZZ